jgi:DNA polymerase-3 subunit delta'
LIFSSKNGILKSMPYNFQWPICGHRDQLKYLQEAISQNKLANTYLFYGAKGLGKKMVVDYFAQSLFCQDPNLKPCGRCYHCRLIAKGTFLDIHKIGKHDELTVENVREWLRSLSLAHISSDRSLAIIYQVENINLFSANALLKTLEEPTKGTTIILVADSLANIPVTIISRSQLIKFRALTNDDMKDWLKNYQLTDEEKQTIINLSFGKPGLALDLINDKLASFKKSSNFIIKLLSNNTFYYMQTIDKWFALLKKEHPGFKIYELGDLTKQYLDLFELFLRDLLWLKLGRPVVNELYHQDLSQLATTFTKESLFKNLLSLNKIKNKLKYNVSPQLLWENLLLNLK